MLRVVLLMLALFGAHCHGAEASAPRQPKGGPGGMEYRHAESRSSRHGEGAEQYWVFEPREPTPKKAPVIIFLHGFSVMHPAGYRAWIEHLVRRGNIVIYPRYQGSLFTPPGDFLKNTLISVQGAMRFLAGEGRVVPDLDRVAVTGHSAGGVLAIKYAAAAKSHKVPVPKVAVLVQPGHGMKRGTTILPLDLEQKLAPEMKLIVAVGADDSIVGDASARRIWRETAATQDRMFITVHSDVHGEPKLRAGHLSPMAPDLDLTDALDWSGWWRFLDAGCEAGFAGRPLAIDPAMGEWSDGQPVKPLTIEHERAP